MNCLDFKRLALSDPNSDEPSFILHAKKCPDCLKYVGSLRQMDIELANSVDVKMPESLTARLQLNQIMMEEAKQKSFFDGFRRYAIAASFAAALFVSGFVASNYFGTARTIGNDYQALLAGVVEHMNEQPLTPVWDSDKANKSVNTHLANYDGKMQLKYLDNLQFSRICPMGKYTGLHASLETVDGNVTFAYIKGSKVEDLLDANYEGYSVRVKPLRDGNLIILGRTNRALKVAGEQLDEALHWNI